jgi:hypothetical protein
MVRAEGPERACFAPVTGDRVVDLGTAAEGPAGIDASGNPIPTFDEFRSIIVDRSAACSRQLTERTVTMTARPGRVKPESSPAEGRATMPEKKRGGGRHPAAADTIYEEQKSHACDPRHAKPPSEVWFLHRGSIK